MNPPAGNNIRCLSFSMERVDGACAFLRVIQPMSSLTQEVQWRTFHAPPGQSTQSPADALRDSDLVLVQRLFPCRDNRTSLDLILRSGKPILYETDDLLHELPENHYLSSFSRENRIILTEFVQRCDLVQVSTASLAEAYRAYNANVRIVPNFLDPTHWFSEVSTSQHTHTRPVVIGFFGTGTHKPDLAIVEDALARLARKHGDAIAFRFLGCATPVLQALPGSSYREQWCTYDCLPETIAHERIDIGIAPLLDSPLNRCKSDLKWLEYSALRIPGVYSAVTPYARSVRDGVTGLVVPNESDAWFAALDRLVLDSDLRRRIAEAAHAEVRATRTLDTGAKLFLDTLRAAASIRPAPGRADRVWDMVMHYENALAEQASRLSKAESDLAWLESRFPHRVAKGLRRLF